MFKQSEEDLAYEEEILRNPYSVKHWLRYCEFKKDAPPAVINLIYERALKEMPGRYQSAVIISYFFFYNLCVCVFVYFSYKLWYSYLFIRRKQTKGCCITDPVFEDTNNTYERALVFMHKVKK